MSEKKTIITISGSIGSGKTSAANSVAEQLGYSRFSTGGYMRKMAEARGMSLLQLLAQAQTDPAINHEIDAELVRQGEGEQLVIDSRLAFHFLPQSYKVYITLPLEVAVDRIMEDKKNNPLRSVEHEATREEVMQAIKDRATLEQGQYQDLYGVTLGNTSDFDLVLSSEYLNKEEIVQAIIAGYMKWNNEG